MPGISRAREALTAARNVAALTGAGVSAESGVPTFRGEGGLWWMCIFPAGRDIFCQGCWSNR